MNKRDIRHYTVLISMLILILSCRFPLTLANKSGQTPVQPTKSSPTKEEILQTPNLTIDAFTLRITETEMTEMIQKELDKQEKPILENPNVLLRDNHVELFGTAKTGLFSGDLHLVASITVDNQGEPVVDIVSGEIGGTSIPSSFLNIFSGMVKQGISSNLGSNATGYHLTEIQVSDGTMTIKGTKR